MSAAPSLFVAHRHLAESEARAWFLPGADAEDVRQEALVALWEAARAFDPVLEVPFTAFARLVIRRRLRDAVRRANGGNHRILTDAVRNHDVPTSHDEVFEARAQLRALASAYQDLSPLEQRSLSAITSGRPASTVGTARQVDNAVQRARRKLKATA